MFRGSGRLAGEDSRSTRWVTTTSFDGAAPVRGPNRFGVDGRVLVAGPPRFTWHGTPLKARRTATPPGRKPRQPSPTHNLSLSPTWRCRARRGKRAPRPPAQRPHWPKCGPQSSRGAHCTPESTPGGWRSTGAELMALRNGPRAARRRASVQELASPQPAGGWWRCRLEPDLSGRKGENELPRQVAVVTGLDVGGSRAIFATWGRRFGIGISDRAPPGAQRSGIRRARSRAPRAGGLRPGREPPTGRARSHRAPRTGHGRPDAR